jgi:predicted transcriptional regulator of viral defense system
MTFDFIRLLKVIEENQLDVFSTGDLSQIFDLSTQNIQNYLETLANNELITRLEKGKYCRIYIRDKFIIGSRIVEGGIISHQSALALHEIDQDTPGEVFVSSSHQKANKTVLGTHINFIRIRPHKYFGSTDIFRRNYKFRATDLEKTILDCLDQPRYVASYGNLVNNIHTIQLDQMKLFDYGMRMGNLSLLKRLAFLFDRTDPVKYSLFLKKVKKIVNLKYTLLDPAGPESGPFNNRWHIRDNLL